MRVGQGEAGRDHTGRTRFRLSTKKRERADPVGVERRVNVPGIPDVWLRQEMVMMPIILAAQFPSQHWATRLKEADMNLIQARGSKMSQILVKVNTWLTRMSIWGKCSLQLLG